MLNKILKINIEINNKSIIAITFIDKKTKYQDFFSDKEMCFYSSVQDLRDQIMELKNNIKKFKDKDSDCKVLVANYASCAEGISLHHVCHDAIYIDRSFQADQYLQSIDRICRLGNNNEKNIYIVSD